MHLVLFKSLVSMDFWLPQSCYKIFTPIQCGDITFVCHDTWVSNFIPDLLASGKVNKQRKLAKINKEIDEHRVLDFSG